jgi:phosphoribosylcarboxyaminoimidazole (NCAIR) mutase
VGIVLGSDSDLEVMLEAVKVLDALGSAARWWWPSAHRTPERTHELRLDCATRAGSAC